MSVYGCVLRQKVKQNNEEWESGSCCFFACERNTQGENQSTLIHVKIYISCVIFERNETKHRIKANEYSYSVLSSNEVLTHKTQSCRTHWRIGRAIYSANIIYYAVVNRAAAWRSFTSQR